MKALKALLIGSSVFAAGAAHAEGQKGVLDIYYIPDSEFEVPGGSDDGDGFGLRGWGMVSEKVFLHGEFQSTETDDAGLETDQLRLGGGVVLPLSDQVWFIGSLEYIDLELSIPGFGSGDTDGYGAHAGLALQATPQLGFYGSLGLVELDDSDGIEFTLEARYNFTESVSGFIDYRSTDQEGDGGDEITITDLRLGIGFHF